MAFYTTQIDIAPAKRGIFKSIIAMLAAGMATQSYQMSRRAQIEALEAKSDEELAEMGLRRDEIAYHVFRDLFYA